MKRLALVVPLGVVLSASAAWACGNSMREHRRPMPNEALVAANRAFKEGRYADAAKLAEQAQRDLDLVGTQRAAALRVGGLSQLKLGHFGDAVTTLEALVKERKEPFARVKLAEARLRLPTATEPERAAALDAMEKLAASGLVSDADALTALGRARLAKGDAAGAKQACERALEVEPGHAESTQLLASLAAPVAKPPQPEAVKLNTKS